MNPFASGRSTYCRLCAPIKRQFKRRDMRRLALSMRTSPGVPHNCKIPPPAVPNTYFGQFIMHDLTQDDTPLSQRNPPDASEIVNHRSPFLNLDSIYGRGPASEDVLLYETDGISFKLGSVCTDKGVPFDVPLDPRTKRPLVADARNAENLIIRQIHAMFLRLHNAAVAEIKATAPSSVLFETARQRVREQYQWLIRNEDGFLIRVCKSAIYDEIIRRCNHHIEWEDTFSIPVEFAHAGGRFGHRMVRAEYLLNKNNGMSLAEIFRESHKRRPLRSDLAIDWRGLFDQGANSIDTSVVSDLFQLGPKAIQPFVEHVAWLESLKLPIRTLYRHIRMRLPTGEQLRDVLDPTVVLSEPECPEYHPFAMLDELGLRGNTPLWYYILLEAELNERGGNLGPIGSRLLCEVMEGALRATPCSIWANVCKDPSWRPRTWAAPNGSEVLINNLFDVAIVVGLAE